MGQQPHPEFVITMKDIYREAAAFARIYMSADTEPSCMEAAYRDGVQMAQDLAKACSDPRNFTMSQELHILQTFMMEALQILTAVRMPMESVDQAALTQAIDDFVKRVETKLQVRRVTEEEVNAANANAAEFEKNTVGDEDSEPTDENIVPFGG